MNEYSGLKRMKNNEKCIFLCIVYVFMSDQFGIPAAMQREIKRLKVLQKETVTMTPNKTQDVNLVKPL